MDYKDTLNLPRTDFAMKADLVTREPERLRHWQATDLYGKILARRAGAPRFILHDGPPFANGDVHIGTALNKILKDIIIKQKTLRGFSSPYVPGWDCHGLPIEFKVSQEMRKAAKATDTAPATPEAANPQSAIRNPQSDFDPATIRKACEDYARKYIGIQREQFKRLGVLGDWDNPYLTLNKDYEANELRLFADLVEQGFVYRGKKPVYWSIPCRTALAEAEVEYQDHVSQSCFVKFPVVGHPGTFVIIWTTTPWTLPANLAVAFNSTFTYSLVRVGVGEDRAEDYIISSLLVGTVAQKCGWDGYQIVRSLDADHLAGTEYQHPFCERTGKLFPGDSFVTNDTGTGFVHIAPGHGMDDYHLGLAQGLPIYSPVDDDGRFAHTGDLPIAQQMPAEMLGKSILEKHGKSDANEAVLHELRVRHALLHQENYHHSYPHCWRSKTPIIFRAMDQWFIKVDHEVESFRQPILDVWRKKGGATGGLLQAGQVRPTLRQRALAAIDGEVRWVPDWGQNRIRSAVDSRPDWCISRQRTWGVPIPFFYDAQGHPLPDPSVDFKRAGAVIENVAKQVQQHGSNVWFEESTAELWARVKPADWTGPAPVAKSVDTLDVWIDSGSSSRAVLMRRPELQHDNLNLPELNSLHDKLTGIPTTVPGRADVAGLGQGHDQAARLSLPRLEDQRRRRLRRLRQEARQAPRGRDLDLPLISLDALGWKLGRADRARLKRSYEVFTEDASTRLAYVGEGMEAFVYRAPENPGVVYKFFPRNVGEHGVALRYELRLDDHKRLDFEVFYSEVEADLVEKVWVLNALGLPTEILGRTEEGAIVVKQAEVLPSHEQRTAEPLAAQTGGLVLYAPSLDAVVVPASIERETKILWFEDEFWLLGDLWEANRMEDPTGGTFVVDGVAAPIPQELINQSAPLRQFLATVTADAQVRQAPHPAKSDAAPITHPWQADLYLEGSDQHRGWFQSSLLLSLAGNGAAPFKTVLTHGFMVDADREKISKSKQGQGGYEKPQTADAYVKKWGADVVRLWVASQDFRSDIVVSEERVNKVGETYRGIRNALRYQLSNLYDFDPAQHTVPDAALTGLDRWILGEFARLEQEVAEAYDRHEFHVVYQRLAQFVAVELSAIYHDTIKDRLYTDPANSARRRSTQTALHRLVTGLCQMLSPILVFTADEAWQFIPGKPTESVHLADWTPVPFTLSESEKEVWHRLFSLREGVLGKLEQARRDKQIGKSLEAKVTLLPFDKASFDNFAPHLEILREVLGTSDVAIQPAPLNEGPKALSYTVQKAAGQKCERCWHWETDVGQHPAHPTLCGRCVEAVT